MLYIHQEKMSKKGRPALPLKERLARRSESVKKSRTKRKEMESIRNKSGLCRTCGEKICPKSKVFCQRHLDSNRARCRNHKKIAFSVLKSNAKRRNIDFLLTIHGFKAWLNAQKQQCHYCDVTCTQLMATGRRNTKLTIDRMDNNLGYSEGNICLSCSRCNILKSDFFTYDEWKAISNDIVKPRLLQFHKLDKSTKN